MKKALLLTIALLCTVVQGAWATDYNVATDSELRAAVQNNNANITLTADINLSDELQINGNKSVTIDLNGHKLDRGLGEASSMLAKGDVFYIASGSSLTINDGSGNNSGKITGGYANNGGGIHNQGTLVVNGGTITGNRAGNAGGGIYNFGTATINGGVISGNTASGNGGGIDNPGTMTISDCTITGNTSNTFGGGISNGNTMTITGGTITGNSANGYGGGIWMGSYYTFNMQGAITVTGNTKAGGLADNLYLANNKVITVTGSLSGSNIGISMETAGTFTSGYNTYNNGVAPVTIFHADLNTVMAVSLVENEVKLVNNLQDGLYYIERSWDAVNKVVVAEDKMLESGSYTTLNGGSDKNLQPGYYVVTGNVTYETLNMTGNGVHHLILCDGAKLTANFVCVEGNNSLHIYGQANSTGQLRVDNPLDNCTGLGSGQDNTAGTIVIHGGDISVHGSDDCAGIGNTIYDNGNKPTPWRLPRRRNALTSTDDATMTIYGGTVKAYGGKNAAGIGGGWHADSGIITINGGKVYAYGGDDAAGIGGGWDTDGGSLTVNGGYVEAHGGGNGAGIGSGSMKITTGVYVRGGDVTITGGEVYAYGGVDAAGIGGGEDADCGTVKISGGFVYAEGNDYGPGIGGGQGGRGGDVTITGGTVIAKAGRQYTPDVETENRAIGPGEGCDEYGTLTIGDQMMVQAGYDGDNYEGIFTAGLRVSACWYRTSARIEPCTHSSLTYTVSGTKENDTHTAHCKYCTTEFTPEKHDFSGGSTCSVCGVESTTTLYTVRTYLPKDQGGGTYDGQTYSCQTTQMASGTTFIMPDCPTIVPGLEFNGWEVSNVTDNPYTSPYTTTGGTILNAGDSYTITANVSFIARYENLDITLLDDASNGETLSHYNGMTVNSVTLSGRTLKKNGDWNTLCLPFNLSAEQLAASSLTGCELMELDTEAGEYAHITGFDKTTGKLYLNFKTATSIEAGKPYIVKWTSGSDITNPVFTNVTISNTTNNVETENVDFIGIYSPKAIAGEDKSILYLGSGNKLYYPSAAMSIKACRTYFHVDLGEASEIREMVVNYDDTTGITTTNFTNDTNSGAWHTLDGRKLQGKPTQKGVYIYNGRKLVVK